MSVRHVLFAFAACAALNSAQAASTTGEVTAFAKAARPKFLASLKDPEAAKLRNVFVSESKPLDGGKGGSLILCGEVNGKNSYGGYVGFRRFYSTGGATHVIDNDEGESFDALYDALCTKPVSKLAEASRAR